MKKQESTTVLHKPRLRKKKDESQTPQMKHRGMPDLFDKCRGDGGYFGYFRARNDMFFSRPVLDGVPGPRMKYQGKDVIMWAINNYMGLAGNEQVKEAARKSLEQWGTFTPMGSRMLTGNTERHIALEQKLAAYLQKPDYPYGGTDEALAETLQALAGDRANFLRALSEGVCAKEVGEPVIQWMWQVFMDASPLAAQTLGELGPLDQRATLAALKMPILSFVGGQDGVVDPAVCRSVSDYNSNADIVEFDAAGHAPFLEEPAGYHVALVNFLNEHL